MNKHNPKKDEIYHWKYMKKYKGPSGKWVYVYDNDPRPKGKEILELGKPATIVSYHKLDRSDTGGPGKRPRKKTVDYKQSGKVKAKRISLLQEYIYDMKRSTSKAKKIIEQYYGMPISDIMKKK